MDEKIDRAIENVLAMIRANVLHEHALKLSQSVLNLAHAKQIIAVVEQGHKSPKKQGAGA